MKYLTLQQTAEKFGVSAKTVRRLAKRHMIPCTSALGPLRFPEALLDEWAKSPNPVTERWFSSKEAEHEDLENGDKKARQVGRSLFLHGCDGQET
ncbi:MAG: helix-turn-helix domain-containing protein [Myxococcales bacterium]|nr:helix-turn-helix domain-containing protein [Myxococcales bacterium]